MAPRNKPRPNLPEPKLFPDGQAFSLPGGKGDIRLIAGDCVAGMSRLAPGSVDVAVTSPPYNLGKAYRTYDDSIPREKYLAWTREWAAELSRVLADDGSFFLNIGGPPKDPWVAFDVLAVFREFLALQNVIHWVKSIAVEARTAKRNEILTFGHYQPIQSPRYLNGCHEFIFHLTKKGGVELDRLAIGVPYQDKSNVTRWKAAAKDAHCRGNTWFIPYETIQSREKERPHPATFPARLPEMCLRLHSLKRVRLAMDPFLGLGSSAVACARLGVPFVGFDIDAGYIEESAKRVREALAGPAS
jgi:site-specific DNA-methyltransferase (adenine-specific)